MHEWFKKKVNSTKREINRFRDENSYFDKMIKVIARFSESNIAQASASASYYLLFSVFPLILFAINLLNYIDPGIAERFRLALPSLKVIIPEPVMDLLLDFIKNVGHNRSVSLISISGIALLWSASSGISNIINSLNKVYQSKKTREINPFIQRVIGLFLAFVFGFTLLLVLMFLSFSDLIITLVEKYLRLPGILDRGKIAFFKYGLALLFLLLTFYFIYSLFSRKRGRRIFSFWLATFTALAWLFISFGISNILVNRGNYDFVYGSLSSIIFLMLWMYMAIFVILFAAFVHSELIRSYEYRQGRSVNKLQSESETCDLQRQDFKKNDL